MSKAPWRTVAGVAVLAALVAALALLAPPYMRNFELAQFIEQTVRLPESISRPPEQLRVAVVNKAAQLGLPVRPEQVRVALSGESLEIEARYIVRVDLAFYTVDLHLRARAGP